MHLRDAHLVCDLRLGHPTQEAEHDDASLALVERVETLSHDRAALVVGRISAGIAWWPMGHNLNVKLFYTYVKPSSPATAWNQLNLQVQLYVF